MAASGRKKHQDIKPEFIIKVPAQLVSAKMSEPQKFQLDLIERTNFNSFNGRKIANILNVNRNLLRSVLMPLDLISLRDMSDGSWHADTMYIYVGDGYQCQLEELVREQFDADEIQWIGCSEAKNILGMTEGENRSDVILFGGIKL
jgi:hypothetical protein